jgi:tetratricopeptide (TPR) repeat protein
MLEPVRRIFPALSSSHSSNQPLESWQVGVVRLPVWLPLKGTWSRTWMALCLGEEAGDFLVSKPGRQEEIPALLEELLSEAGRKWRTRPARVQVADAELAGMLESFLAPHGVKVEAGAELPELAGLMGTLVLHLTPEDLRPSPLTGAGVTVERLRAFARAAADFYASPCRGHLTGDDLIRVEAPKVGEAFRTVVVDRIGPSGVGLCFLPDLSGLPDVPEPPDLESLMADVEGAWAIVFDQPWDAPPEDLDLWERYGLPWAGKDLCPVALFAGPEVLERPDRRQLAFLEGLLAALAATTEEELDSGRWKKRVATAEGPVRFVLSLPGLLEPDEAGWPLEPSLPWNLTERALRVVGKLMKGKDFDSLNEANEFLVRALAGGLPEVVPETPQERAEELIDQAWEVRGRRSVLLARQALEVWPDCADAYNLLAGRAPGPEAAAELFTQALAAGERALGAEAFEKAGHFWGLLGTRPYMRALEGLAESLVELKRFAEAAGHLREMLRLNPDDSQGARYSLASLLIALDQDGEAEALLDRYGEDSSALLAYPRALLGFRRQGDTLEARRHLKRAVQANRFVPGLLLLYDLGLPPLPPTYRPGDEDEAVVCAGLSCETWKSTPGALDWLRRRTEAGPGPRAKARRGKKRGKKKRRR